MARRRAKTSQQTNETQARILDEMGGEQAQLPPGNDAPAHTGNGALAADTRTRIEKLAFQLYQQRGCRHGDDWKDWLEAERLTVTANAYAE